MRRVSAMKLHAGEHGLRVLTVFRASEKPTRLQLVFGSVRDHAFHSFANQVMHGLLESSNCIRYQPLSAPILRQIRVFCAELSQQRAGGLCQVVAVGACASGLPNTESQLLKGGRGSGQPHKQPMITHVLCQSNGADASVLS